MPLVANSALPTFERLRREGEVVVPGDAALQRVTDWLGLRAFLHCRRGYGTTARRPGIGTGRAWGAQGFRTYVRT